KHFSSTNYHYFSSEMVFTALSLILNLPADKITILKTQENSYYNFAVKRHSLQTGLWSVDDENRIILNDIVRERLIKIFEFSSAIISESGLIPQFGDNDGGQLLITNFELQISDNLNLLSLMKNVLKLINKYLTDKSLTSGKLIKKFKDFGLYILENNGMKIFVRCGSIGQNGKGGHCHNDQLSFELFIDNNAVIVDPGTYVYTPNPELRNEYRSTRMHNTLWLEGFEQNDWDNDSVDDLFWLKKDKTKARMIEFSDSYFVGEHYGFGKPHRREITVGSQQWELDNSKVIGIDFCDLNKTKFVSFHFAPEIEIKLIEKNQAFIYLVDKIVELKCSVGKFRLKKYFYSPSYGVRVEAEKLVIESRENRIEWQIEIKTE
ncbi:MAG: heparinase II/III-family protein, partial [Bacteroidetes bacterium]|nr:heparinase II/III-family protein [Bacteroidota bacterium]